MEKDPEIDADDHEQAASEGKPEADGKKGDKDLAKKKRLLEKKFAQGLATLEKMEKRKPLEIVGNEASVNVLFIYFGVPCAEGRLET